MCASFMRVLYFIDLFDDGDDLVMKMIIMIIIIIIIIIIIMILVIIRIIIMNVIIHITIGIIINIIMIMMILINDDNNSSYNDDVLDTVKHEDPLFDNLIYLIFSVMTSFPLNWMWWCSLGKDKSKL